MNVCTVVRLLVTDELEQEHILKELTSGPLVVRSGHPATYKDTKDGCTSALSSSSHGEASPSPSSDTFSSPLGPAAESSTGHSSLPGNRSWEFRSDGSVVLPKGRVGINTDSTHEVLVSTFF